MCWFGTSTLRTLVFTMEDSILVLSSSALAFSLSLSWSIAGKPEIPSYNSTRLNSEVAGLKSNAHILNDLEITYKLFQDHLIFKNHFPFRLHNFFCNYSHIKCNICLGWIQIYWQFFDRTVQSKFVLDIGYWKLPWVCLAHVWSVCLLFRGFWEIISGSC